MRWTHKVTTVFVACCIGGGVGTVLNMPAVLTATTLSDPSASAPSPDLTTYALDVQQLLQTTYLGHTNKLPDPGEPAEALQKYLEQNAHGYQDQLLTQDKKLDDGLMTWEDLVQRYPKSRHARVALAKHYRAKAIASGDIAYTRQAADAYIRAADLGLENGRIRYTRELSTLLVKLGDRKGLDEVFGRILQSSDINPDNYYFALVYYADGLARFSDERARGYFEQAIDLHPENNLEAINRYAQHLLTWGDAQKAFEILDTYLTSEQRVRFVLPAQLRKQAMEQVGLDTASADVEIALTSRRLKGAWAAALPVVSDREPSDTVTVTTAASETTGTETAVMAASVHDPRVSAIFAIRKKNNRIAEDAIFSPTNATNNIWPNMKPVTETGVKLATIKLPNGKAGLFRIGTDNLVHYRYFNGDSWDPWKVLGSGSAIDISAVVWPNGEADVFRVDGNQCDVYVKHSTDGQSWGKIWNWWGSCGDQIAVSVMPNGTAWALLRTPYLFGQHVAVKRYFNGSAWDNFWVFFPDPQVSVDDIDLLAYPNPGSSSKMIALAIGSGDCGLYYRDWNGSSWTNWSLAATCYKQVSSFSTYTSDGGAYMLLLDANNLLHMGRFDGSVWSGIRPPDTQTTWLAAAGINIDDETGNAYEHTQTADDCRVSSFLFGPVCDSHGNCFYTQGVNLAEIIYNEAAGETLGAEDAVGWTVRDRAFEGLSNTDLCGSYVGAETGGTITATCRANVQCNAPGLCDNTPRYCCVMHGGKFQVGTSGYQFDDEHVDMNTLTSSGVMFEAELVGTGLVPDMSTSWCPSGIGQCYFDCLFPDSDQFISNYSEPSPHGPMEFQSSAYPLPNPSCQQAPTANTCPGGATNSVCCNASPNNYFWNRK